MKTYNNTINEYQRILLLNALHHMAATMPDLLKSQQGDDSVLMPNDNAFEEVSSLIDMLTSLPEDEKTHPGINHGLCF